MDAGRAGAGGPDEQLYAAVLEFLESTERGAPPDTAGLLARHPDLAPELNEFLEAFARLETLAAPVRSASRALVASAGPGPAAPPRQDDTPGGRSAESVGGGRPGRGLPLYPPLSAEHYPFLSGTAGQEELGRLGPYRLLEAVGRGGMGVVFRGEDVHLHRAVAVKVLRTELAADPSARERFLREARSAAALDHEHVVAVYHVGEQGGVPFLGMQWLTGASLEELLRRAGRLDVPAAVRLGRQAALGLAAAHGRGLLHRDIKPANLWVEPPAPGSAPAGAGADAAGAGRLKILDFGLARAAEDEGQLTASGVTVGTPAYMAPEQARGGPVDARCDLFSLGVVLYRMLAGRHPFARPDPAAPAGPPAAQPTPVRELNPAVPPGLADLVMELLARDPADRPASAAGVAARLLALEERAAAPEASARPATPAAPPTAPPVPRSSGGRTWRRRATVVALALAVLLALGYLFGGTVVRFATNRGEVVIAVDDPDAAVTVREGGAVIEDHKGQRRITLAAGEHELEVTVKDPAGEVRFPFKKTIVVTRGGKEVVNVREELARLPERKPRGAGGEPKVPAAAGTGERRAAEWVLSLGGRVLVSGTDGEKAVQTVNELPADHFTVVLVELNRTAVTDAGLAHLAGLTGLRYLHLTGTRVTDAGLAHIEALPRLKYLNLVNTRVTDAGLGRLRTLPDLETLLLSGTRVTDAGLAQLEGIKSLRSVELERTQVGDTGLASLGGLTTLRDLDLRFTRVTDAGLARLGALQNLQSLNLGHTPVTDAGVSRLRALTNLQDLVLTGTKVTDAGLACLGALAALRDLDLNVTGVGDAGLASLPAIKKLRGVSLGGTRVTDAGLAHLAGLTGLQYLQLNDTRVTDAGLARLAGLTGLYYLQLNDTQVTDAGLAHLGAMKQLRKLYLSGTRITDAGLAHFLNVPLPPLTQVELNGSRVSATGAAAVKGILPGVQLDWWEPNRRAAEAVLAAGGSVHVRTGRPGSDAPIQDAAALPAEYFRLTRAGLVGVRHSPREPLRLLAALTDPEFDDLEEVDLSGSAVADADLESLRGATCRRLVLNRTALFGLGLMHLKGLPRLTDLSLECPTLSFLGVRYVAELKGLKRLSLAGTGTTDANLKDLRALVGLRELDLTGTKVTADGVAALRQALPACAVKAKPAGPQ